MSVHPQDADLAEFLSPGDLLDDRVVYTSCIRYREATDYSKARIEMDILVFTGDYQSIGDILFPTLMKLELHTKPTEDYIKASDIRNMLQGRTIRRVVYNVSS